MKKNKFKLNEGGDPGKPKIVKLGEIRFNDSELRKSDKGDYYIVKDKKSGKDYGVVKDGNSWRFKTYYDEYQARLDKSQNAYQSTIEKNNQRNNFDNFTDSQKKDYIEITKGKDTGLKVPKRIIDSALVSSKRTNTDPNILLGLLSRESSYGIDEFKLQEDRTYGRSIYGDTHPSTKTNMVSAWSKDLKDTPSSSLEFLYSKGAKGLTPYKTSDRWGIEVTDTKQYEDFINKNSHLVKEYEDKIKSFKVQTNGDSFDWANNKLKNEGLQSYNPGDPRYPQMLQKDINAVKSDTAIQNYIKRRTPQLKYNTGGKVGFEDVAGLASAFVNPISAIPSALDLIGKLAYNPASYTPAKMNESPMGYAYGGDMEQALQIAGGNDHQMGDHAVQVEGNPGVDTNYRNIGGQDVALTQGEIVRQDQDGSAYVWSNNPKMKHPSGTTFAKAMKPIENKIARLKSRVEKDHTDVYASNALGHLEQMVEQNKNIEETMRQKKGSPTAQRFNNGGRVKATLGYDQVPNELGDAPPIYLSQQILDRQAFEVPKIQTGLERFGTTTNSPFTAPKNFLKANPSPLTSVTGNGLPKTESLSTFEDKAFLGAKSLETAFRVGAALDKPMQYDTRRYNVDRIRYSPQRALDANQANYQGAQYDINTGNANTDRILRNNLYGQKMAADRDVIGKNDQMQNQSDLQVNQYNAQAKANVDNINEQIRGRDYQATDAALTSIGNLSSIFQQAGGAKAHNRITMSTLNSLSRRYGIDVPELMALMQGEGDLNKGTVKYKGK